MATSELSSLPWRLPYFRVPGVPMLLYHRLADTIMAESGSRDWEYDVQTSAFAKHMQCIRNSGVRVLSVREILDNPTSSGEEATAGITFDDGFASDYEKAFPLLMAHGIRADFFVNTANIGKAGYLSWEQMREMQKSGMSFQSHGHAHVALSHLGHAALERELVTSRRMLEDNLGCEVDCVAAPYGLLNRTVVNEALRLGYRGVCTSRQWTAKIGSRCINRVAVLPQTSLPEFLRLLFRHPTPYVARSLRAIAIYIPRQILLKIRPAHLGVRVLEEQR